MNKKIDQRLYWIQTTIWFDTNIIYFVSFETKIIYQNNYCTLNPRNAKIKYISRKLNQSIICIFEKIVQNIIKSKNY